MSHFHPCCIERQLKVLSRSTSTINKAGLKNKVSVNPRGCTCCYLPPNSLGDLNRVRRGQVKCNILCFERNVRHADRRNRHNISDLCACTNYPKNTLICLGEVHTAIRYHSSSTL
ncbi:hypothetical protein ATANTOWER_002678 [Ataeniobius toweri]|uniref:Uncharacterized protein n=1 Tax=Ataeniobius toweri TaxID=208326 RepID=A0ABU7A573_9TELE|nr:hypothetical protein [Ataeniobius toweri]